MRYKRCPNPACARPFQINRFNAALSPLKEGGKITCPHCGLEIGQDTNSVFLTHALSQEQEAAFNIADAPAAAK